MPRDRRPLWIYEGPETPLTETSLFTGAPGDPPLARTRSRDGLRLLMPAFEELRDRRIPVRVITTPYSL